MIEGWFKGKYHEGIILDTGILEYDLTFNKRLRLFSLWSLDNNLL